MWFIFGTKVNNISVGVCAHQSPIDSVYKILTVQMFSVLYSRLPEFPYIVANVNQVIKIWQIAHFVFYISIIDLKFSVLASQKSWWKRTRCCWISVHVFHIGHFLLGDKRQGFMLRYIGNHPWDHLKICMSLVSDSLLGAVPRSPQWDMSNVLVSHLSRSIVFVGGQIYLWKYLLTCLYWWRQRFCQWVGQHGKTEIRML